MQLYEGECPSSGWRRPGKEPQGSSYACYIVQGVARLPCPRLRSRTLTSPPAVHTPRSRPPHSTFSNSSTLPPPRPPRSPPFRSGLLRHAQAGPRASVQDRPHRPQVRDGAAPQQGDRPGAAHRAAVPVAARHGHAGSGRRRRRRWRRLIWAGDIRPGRIQGRLRTWHGGVAGHGGSHAQRATGQGLPRAVQVNVVGASSHAFHCVNGGVQPVLPGAGSSQECADLAAPPPSLTALMCVCVCFPHRTSGAPKALRSAMHSAALHPLVTGLSPDTMTELLLAVTGLPSGFKVSARSPEASGAPG